MIEEHFPDFYHRADAHSVAWQKRYLWSQKVQLAALLVAAAVAAFVAVPMLTAAFFGLSITAQLYRLSTRADEKWWNGRAGAESAKTAAWLYVVGGEPFSLRNAQAALEFATRLTEVGTQVANLVPVPVSQAHVTAEMTSLREQPLAERVETYQRDRIRSQCKWYASKSVRSEKLARNWALAALGTQGLALAAGIAAAANGWQQDFVGLFVALTATAVAWAAVKQYDTLARSYAVASSELSTIDVRISNTTWTENDWAAFVNAAEEAISREHTSWRASRAA